jgi:hypothetical protein
MKESRLTEGLVASSLAFSVFRARQPAGRDYFNLKTGRPGMESNHLAVRRLMVQLTVSRLAFSSQLSSKSGCTV